MNLYGVDSRIDVGVSNVTCDYSRVNELREENNRLIEENNALKLKKQQCMTDLMNVDRAFDKMIVSQRVKKIIFNEPATIVLWDDDTKTVVKTTDGDVYDPYVGFCMALAKKIYDNNSAMKKMIARKSNIEEWKKYHDRKENA